MTTHRLRSARSDLTAEETTCAFVAAGLCTEAPGSAACRQCRRYADLLRSARDLYEDVRWILSPDGMLYGIHDTEEPAQVHP